MSMRSLHAQLRPDPREVSRARRMLADRLADWGLDPDATDVAVLLTSEVVTNAILHGRPPVELVVLRQAGCVRVEVSDGGSTTPDLRPMTPEALGGRGLHLVDQLARRWGTGERAARTTVWFEVATA